MSNKIRLGKPVGRPKRPPPGEGASDTRARILEVAEQHLGRFGYAGMSMEQVASAVGVTKGALYHHFRGGKDDLILGVGRQLLDRNAQGISRAVESAQSARDQLEAIAAWMCSRSGQAERMLQDAQHFLPEAHNREIYEGFMTHLYAPVEGVLQRGVAQGEFRPHDTAFSAWAFLGLLSGLDYLRTIMTPSDLARQIVEFVTIGIRRPDGT